MKSKVIEMLRNSEIVCWGLGRHFYSSTYDFLKREGLTNRVKLLVDHKVTNIDNSQVPLLANCIVSTPDKIRSFVSGDAVILISVRDYQIIAHEIQITPDLATMKWIPDLFLIFLKMDEDILDAGKMSYALEPCRNNTEMKIPKVINTFWFSDDPLPDKYVRCMNSWKKYCPDYEIRVWSLIDYNSGGNRYFDEAILSKKWAFASDYSRIDIICRNGGIYMDLDVEMVKPIDELLYNKAYLGFEDLEKVDCGSGFGSIAGNNIFEEIRDEYKDRSFILPDGTFDQTICPVIYTDVLAKHGLIKNGMFQIVDGITVYPFEYLSAKSFYTGIIYKTEKTYTIHHHEGSWLSDESKKDADNRYNLIERLSNMTN